VASCRVCKRLVPTAPPLPRNHRRVRLKHYHECVWRLWLLLHTANQIAERVVSDRTRGHHPVQPQQVTRAILKRCQGRWGLTGGMMFERTCGCHDSDSDLQTTNEALKANGHRGAPYLPRLSDVRPLRVQRQGHRCKCNLAIILFGLQQSPNAGRPDYSVEGGRAELTGGGNASVHGSRTTHCSHPHQN